MFIPLELAIKPSRIYSGVMLAACGLAMTGVWLAVMPVGVRAALALLLLLAAVHYWRKGLSGVHGLRIMQSGHLEILQANWLPAVIRGQPVVLPWLISLVVLPEGGKARRLMIWPDSVDADSARRLRVWLKWGHQPLG